MRRRTSFMACFSEYDPSTRWVIPTSTDRPSTRFRNSSTSLVHANSSFPTSTHRSIASVKIGSKARKRPRDIISETAQRLLASSTIVGQGLRGYEPWEHCGELRLEGGCGCEKCGNSIKLFQHLFHDYDESRTQKRWVLSVCQSWILRRYLDWAPHLPLERERELLVFLFHGLFRCKCIRTLSGINISYEKGLMAQLRSTKIWFSQFWPDAHQLWKSSFIELGVQPIVNRLVIGPLFQSWPSDELNSVVTAEIGYKLFWHCTTRTPMKMLSIRRSPMSRV